MVQRREYPPADAFINAVLDRASDPAVYQHEANIDLQDPTDPIAHARNASEHALALAHSYGSQAAGSLGFSYSLNERLDGPFCDFHVEVYIKATGDSMKLVTLEGCGHHDDVRAEWHNSQLQRLCEGE